MERARLISDPSGCHELLHEAPQAGVLTSRSVISVSLSSASEDYRCPGSTTLARATFNRKPRKHHLRAINLSIYIFYI